MPHLANTHILQSILPKDKNEQVKNWRYRLAEALGLSEARIRYYLIDERSKRLSQAYLIRVREKNQKVRSKINNLKHAGVQHGNSSETN